MRHANPRISGGGIGAALLVSLFASADCANDDAVAKHYGTFDSPALVNATFSEVRKLLLQGRPFVVVDGARGLPMASWTCDFVKKEFPDSLIRQEGGRSDKNTIQLSSDWTGRASRFADSEKYPEGAPKIRPFYWDIAKASEDERHRNWGKNPKEVVNKLVGSSAVPYWLPAQSAQEMGYSSEMWFHPPGAGAPAHMDPHCKTTVSFCFSGARRWRMMVPPAKPHPDGYFDGQIYGASDASRRGEWKPTFEFEAPAGSAVVVYPGMVHETLSTGAECSSSISQTFATPVAAAYFRAFWPRFALVGEDVGGCGDLVETMVVLGSGTRVPAAGKTAARKAADSFAARVDSDADGVASEAEIVAQNKRNRQRLSIEELVSFHDVDEDGVVSTKELVESWVMYATAMRLANKHRRPEGDL